MSGTCAITALRASTWTPSETRWASNTATTCPQTIRATWTYQTSEPGVRDLNRLVIEIFRNPGYVAFYVIGMVVVGFHLWHGAASSVQTLGADTPRVTPIVRRLGVVLAIVIAVGFLSIPLWVFFTGGRS